MKIELADEHIDLIAETMCAAYFAKVPGAGWAILNEQEREDWRRTVRAAARLLASMPYQIRIAP